MNVVNLRSYAPAIEAHRALASATASKCRGPISQGLDTAAAIGDESEPVAWAVILPMGAVVCSPAELPEALSGTCPVAEDEPPLDADASGNNDGGGGATPIDDGTCWSGSSLDEVSPFDHIYPRDGWRPEGDGSSSPTVILYGALGSPAMMAFHRELKTAAARGDLQYIFRHALPYRDAGHGTGRDRDVTTLQGYGVVLDVKNMEYKNYDSSASTVREIRYCHRIKC